MRKHIYLMLVSWLCQNVRNVNKDENLNKIKAITDVYPRIWALKYIMIINLFFFPGSIPIWFLAVQNSSIGDLVTHSLSHSGYFYFWHYRVTLETCDLWYSWTEWWGDIAWPKKDNDKDKHKDKIHKRPYMCYIF